MRRTTIASAADEAYFPLLSDLVRSIRDKPESAGVDLSVYDLGLSAEQCAWLEQQGATLVRPGWDLRLSAKHAAPEHRKAMTSRPFLPKHFPGYEIYVWLDADAWVQGWSAIELLVRAARAGALGVVAEVDRAYPVKELQLRVERVLGIPYRVSSYGHRKFRAAYGDEIARHLIQQATVNSGVFALRGDAPHWAAWRECYQAALDRSSRDGSDQVSLNYLCYTSDLPLELLPATCNWVTGKALPRWDGAAERFVEPYLPHAEIGVVHLTGAEKHGEHEVVGLDGQETRRSLRYPGRGNG